MEVKLSQREELEVHSHGLDRKQLTSQGEAAARWEKWVKEIGAWFIPGQKREAAQFLL